MRVARRAQLWAGTESSPILALDDRFCTQRMDLRPVALDRLFTARSKPWVEAEPAEWGQPTCSRSHGDVPSLGHEAYLGASSRIFVLSSPSVESREYDSHMGAAPCTSAPPSALTPRAQQALWK